MNISIDNFKLDLSKCNYEGDIITLGYEFLHAKKLLSNKDFDIFISDTITHEFIHSILMNFDLTTSKLFDTVEHFIGDISIKKKVFKAIRKFEGGSFPITWSTSIKKYGFKDFLDTYHLDKNDIIQSYILTGRS